jgi:hypothetical protein
MEKRKQYPEAQHAHYVRNRARYIAKSKEQRQSFLFFIRDLKTNQPCHDCNVVYNPWQMQFDHTGNDKLAAVSSLVVRGNIGLLIEEIKKCDLVCANCHMDRTHKRLLVAQSERARLS